MASTSIYWFRRDLRLNDNPALLAAMAESEKIVPVFILDPRQIKKLGDKGKAYLAQSLRLLDESIDNNLHVIAGNPLTVLKELSAKHKAISVHLAASYEPFDSKEEIEIESAGIKLVRTGSPYAVAPGRVKKPSDDTPYRVYTPFYKAWSLHGWRKPADKPKAINAIKPTNEARAFPDWKIPNGVKMTPAGEVAALERFKHFQKNGLNDYDQARNLAGIDGTSKMSAHLTWGEIHPRTLLAPLGESKAHDVFRKEIAWREFYADVLFHNPHTETDYYAPQFAGMRYDKPGEKFKAWCEGKTGFPFVDAAMRQLLTEGWMHNRTRMVVASFLVKDLHLEWQLGERFFREHLVDYDVASNAHGWQWTAGCGTDASPYYRIFNPIEQGKRFDENGDYVRKYVPELAHIKGIEVQEPWEAPDGYAKGYVKQIVDHKVERNESLARLEEIKVNKPAYPKD
jgi:deoxyribodipyrimidine photo-lyase